MKKFYAVKIKACLLLIGMQFLGLTMANAQFNPVNAGEQVDHGEQVEGPAHKLYSEIAKKAKLETGITPVEASELTQYFADSIGFYKSLIYSGLYTNRINGLNQADYANSIEARLVKLYNVYKQIKTEFPSTIAASLRPTHGFASGVCNPACDNIDFETGTLSAWTACYSDCTKENSGTASSFLVTQPMKCSGPLGAVTTAANDPATTSNQVSITSGAGCDPVAGCAIPVVCPTGGKYSCMIGDGTNPGYGVAELSQTFQVTPANMDFYYMYAVVLQNPAGHTYYQQPYFNVAMLDQNGDTIPHCGNYSVVAGGGTGGKGWVKTTFGGADCYYLPWTTAFVSLKKYEGQCVTVVIITSDCGQGGHFGYAYFDSKCAPLSIITSSQAICGKPITLTAPPGGVAYQWTGPAGCVTPAAGNTQSISASCPGKYTVIITDVVGAACADTLDTIISGSVAPPPIANFKSDTVCAGNPTQFTNLTTDTGSTSYDWNFGDPGSGTLDSSKAYNPTHTYPAGGTYTVTLKASGPCGTSDTSFPVIVIGPPTAAFTASTVCLNAPTVFTNTSTGSTLYKWIFGDGTTSTAANPTHTYKACGVYTVTLVVGKAPCVDSVKHTDTVNAIPLPGFTANTVCVGTATTFTDTSKIACGGTITSWSWNFGDGSALSTLQNPTHTYAAVGKYNVQLTVTSKSGCQSSVTLPVQVVGPPVANFTTGPVCLGQVTNFIDQSTGTPTTYSWSFGDGSTSNVVGDASHTYGATGTYTVKLVVASGAGCKDSITKTVTVNPNPVAAFTATSVCQGTATTFTDGSTGATSWSWSFGDPAKGTSTVQNPTYTYAKAGTYTVKEVVTSATGCKDSITQTITVNPIPSGSFTVPPVCLGTASVFTLTTTMVGGTYAWNFGDAPPGTSTVANPTYTYGKAGTYNPSVVLTSTNGCTATVNGTAVVNPIPVANFTAPAVCQDHSMFFFDKSTVAAPSTIKSWAWNFGDGSSSTLQNPTHKYAACGTYNVMLTVTSNAGCSHDTTIPVTINPMPIPAFTATNVCQGLANSFTDGSTIACGGTIKTWSWAFGDGGTSTVQNPTHQYATAGTYTATLTVTSNNGCDSSVSVPVTVYPIPVPKFISTSVCQGSATIFTNQSTVTPPSTIVGSAWSFGDPAHGTSNQTNPSYIYAAAGNYTATLVVVSNFGCVDSVKGPVIVDPIPVPDFVANDTMGCAPLCVKFTDLSKVTAPSTVTGWLWNFGDGSSDSSSTLQNPTHCYSKVGVFTVTLTVTTNNGCTQTFTRVNYITTWPTPVANFNASPNPTVLVNNPTVTFTDLSTGNPISWTWATFGDALDSVKYTQNTTHTYQDTGTFYVKLVIVNKYGCKDSIVEPVVVQPIWTFYVPNAFTPNGDGLNDGFIGKGIGILKYEMWIFDRWGMLLYHCTDMQHPWNGTVQGTSGKECQEDTYVWLIDITDVFHNAHRYIGRVSIIK